MAWQFARARRWCATDPEWAEIEARRHRDGPGVVLFSDKLGWSAFERQRKIAARVAPDPSWVPAVRWVKDRPVSR